MNLEINQDWKPKHLKNEWETVEQKTKDFFTRRMEESRKKVLEDSFEQDGVFYWKVSKTWDTGLRHVLPDVIEDAGLIVPETHQKSYDEDTAKFFAEYREAMKNHVPSEEELAEMRAAFGPGEKVVNVITGQEYNL